MKKNETIILDNNEHRSCTCFWSLNKLIKTPEIVNSIRSILTYRIYLNFHKKTLNELRQNPRVEIEISDIICGKLKGDMYRQIDNALAELKAINLKQIDITKPRGDIKYVSLFRETGYTKKNGKRIVWVSLEENAFPILEKMLLEGYTKIPSSDVVNIPTIHGTRTYEMLTMLSKTTDTAYFSIENFKECIGIPKTKYPHWPNLRQRIINPDKKIINANTEISYDIRPKIVKKKTVGIYFINISNKSKQYIPSEPHIKAVNEHIWPSNREQILDNYSPEYIMHYHKKCHSIAECSSIGNFDSFFFKSIIEDKDNYNFMVKEKQEKNRLEQKIKDEKEKEVAESERLFNFAMDCYRLLPDNDKHRYRINISGFTDNATIEDIAVVKFLDDNEQLLKKSDSPDNFIKAFNLN